MDGIGTRGKWKKKCPIDALAFLCMLILASGTHTSQPLEKTCNPPHFKTDNGICCNKCHQGYKLTKECEGDGRQSTCEPCEKGKSYNAFINYSPNCRSCTKCKDRDDKEEESKCTTVKDTVCRCKNGFYKDKIDSETFQCLGCTECGVGQKREQNCTQEHNTVCRCADGHYADKSKCLPCELCTASECTHLCPSVDPSTCKDPNSPSCREDGNSFSTALLIGVSATTVLLVVVGFITYKVTKHTTTRKLVSSISTDTNATSVTPDSADCTEVLIDSFEEHPDNVCDKAFPPSSVCMQDPSNLPDCIPKISELIYTVLHLVPVARVKELARKLDVPDIEIERAEADHRLSKEAHYQMLKVWADRGLRVGGAALVGRGDVQQQQQPWLQELLAKLEDMNLGLAAQELEKKYSCQ